MDRLPFPHLHFRILLSALLVCGLAAYAQANPLKHLVNIGGNRRLNIVCAGRGSPTVVFMQGATADITSWRYIWKPVSTITRACVYDRAGAGYSDPSDKPATTNNVADDLHALLSAAGIKGRVVLVGHSLGGLFATYYADKFTPSVAGMVLIDPSFAGQFDSFNAVNPKDMGAMHRLDLQWNSQIRECEKLARDSKLATSNTHDCFQLPTDLRPNEREYVTQQFVHPAYYASVISESDGLNPKWTGNKFEDGIDGDQERQVQRPLGDLPIDVLSAANSFQNPRNSRETNATMEKHWLKGHDSLAHRSAHGVSIVVPNSHHSIQRDQPQAVLDAIKDVVAKSRQF